MNPINEIVLYYKKAFFVVLMAVLIMPLLVMGQDVAAEVVFSAPWYKNPAVIITMLLGLSEVLGMIPGIKSNGVFQLIGNVLKSLKKTDKK